MISQYDVIKYYERAKESGKKTPFYLSDDKKEVFDSETNERLCSIEHYVNVMRKHLHCDFEVIYYEHATLEVVYRCKECGTVIFASDSCEEYDDNLCCPTCGGYETGFEYWTKEEIANDEKKKNTLEFFDKIMKERKEEDERMKKRGGLYDWQRWVKRFKTKNYRIEIWGICSGWGHKGIKKDRYIEIYGFKKEENGSYTIGNNHGFHYQIPLNWYAFYIRYIYPYQKSCHPSVRKYAFWQKKPVKEDVNC